MANAKPTSFSPKVNPNTVTDDTITFTKCPNCNAKYIIERGHICPKPSQTKKKQATTVEEA